jgi:hypothetical protein
MRTGRPVVSLAFIGQHLIGYPLAVIRAGTRAAQIAGIRTAVSQLMLPVHRRKPPDALFRLAAPITGIIHPVRTLSCERRLSVSAQRSLTRRPRSVFACSLAHPFPAQHHAAAEIDPIPSQPEQDIQAAAGTQPEQDEPCEMRRAPGRP